MPLAYPPGYDPGYVGALHYQFGAALTSPATVADVTPPSSNWSVAGPCSLPAFDTNDNMRPVQGIGSGRDLRCVSRGRRENTLSTRLDVCDASMLVGAFRDHDTPGTRAGGYVNGLPLMHLLVSQAGSQYETGVAVGDDTPAMAGLDALINSLRMEIAENQNVTADIEWWPLVLGDCGALPSAAPAWACPIIWQSVDILVGGTSYKPYLAGVSFGLNNGLERNGSRNVLYRAVGKEAYISRTAYAVTPKLEQLQVSYRLHRKTPLSWRQYLQVGQIVITGASVDGLTTMGLVIDNNYLNRHGGQQAQANAMQTFTADTLSNAVAFTWSSVAP